LDNDGRVIYVGSFSKMLFPAIRLGYLVVPKHLIRAFTSARAVSGLHASTPTQAVVAEFISEGHFVRHLRRMRNLYLERQKVLLRAAAAELNGIMSFEPADAGMHLVGWLAPGVDDRKVSAVALAAGIETVPLSGCSMIPGEQGALLLSYTGVRPPLIWRGIRDLAVALQQFRAS
jgi:GntR family transcriptional regulator/MocR family aminotransferase